MKMYRALTGFHNPVIEEIEVTKETESSVWIEGQTGAFRKETQYATICKTWEEAFKVLTKYHTEKVDDAYRTLKNRLAAYDCLKDLKKGD